jgi:hypothetical protein
MLDLFPKVLDVGDLNVGDACWLFNASFLLAEIVIDKGNSIVWLLSDQRCDQRFEYGGVCLVKYGVLHIFNKLLNQF